MNRLFLIAVTVLLLQQAAAGSQAPEYDRLPKGSIEGSITAGGKKLHYPIVVFLKQEGGAVKFPTPPGLKISQKDGKFDPPFAVAVVGQEVIFSNDEVQEIPHNVYFLGSESGDLAIFGRKETRPHQFTQPGEVNLYCSIHKLMDAKIFVVPTPAFTVLHKDEPFAIANVPEGDYQLETYQRTQRFKDARVRVQILGGQTTREKIELKR